MYIFDLSERTVANTLNSNNQLMNLYDEVTLVFLRESSNLLIFRRMQCFKDLTLGGKLC
jgi:hypothetical protein